MNNKIKEPATKYDLNDSRGILCQETLTKNLKHLMNKLNTW